MKHETGTSMVPQLRRLDEIGGWVEADEVAYQLGDEGTERLRTEGVAEGLVEVRTLYTLTPLGQAVARATTEAAA